MTVQEAITQSQAVRPSQYDRATMVRWLSDLDQEMFDSLVKNHWGLEETPHGPYTELADLTTELMAPDPYSRLYVLYLNAQVDFYNGEIGRYNNTTAAYNEARQAYADWINRENMPKQKNFVKTGFRHWYRRWWWF